MIIIEMIKEYQKIYELLLLLNDALVELLEVHKFQSNIDD